MLPGYLWVHGQLRLKCLILTGSIIVLLTSWITGKRLETEKAYKLLRMEKRGVGIPIINPVWSTLFLSTSQHLLNVTVMHMYILDILIHAEGSSAREARRQHSHSRKRNFIDLLLQLLQSGLYTEETLNVVCCAVPLFTEKYKDTGHTRYDLWQAQREFLTPDYCTLWAYLQCGHLTTWITQILLSGKLGHTQLISSMQYPCMSSC